MSEEAEAVAPPGSGDGGPPPQAQAEAPSSEPVHETGSDEGTETAAEGETAEPETVELDIWGEKISLPKGQVPDEILSKLDEIAKGTQRKYTTETQRLAEDRKALEAERTVVQKLGALREDALQAFSQGLALKQEIARYEAEFDDAIRQSDRDRAVTAQQNASIRRALLDRVAAQVSEHETRAAAEEQQYTARLAEEGRQKVTKRIKGFNESEVIDYAIKTYGIPEEQARAWPLNPSGAEMAWKAMMFDRLQARAVPAAKPPAPPSAPVKSIASRAAPSATDPSKMTTEQFMKWRNSQIAKRRG